MKQNVLFLLFLFFVFSFFGCGDAMQVPPLEEFSVETGVFVGKSYEQGDTSLLLDIAPVLYEAANPSNGIMVFDFIINEERNDFIRVEVPKDSLKNGRKVIIVVKQNPQEKNNFSPGQKIYLHYALSDGVLLPSLIAYRSWY